MDVDTVIAEAKEHLLEGAPKEQVYEEAKAKFRNLWLDHWEYADAVKALTDAIKY